MNRALKEELKTFQEAAAYQAEMDSKAARSKQLRDEESKFEKPHPLEVYLDMLAASDEASIKDSLMGMGSAVEVPKLFRNHGKVGFSGILLIIISANCGVYPKQ